MNRAIESERMKDRAPLPPDQMREMVDRVIQGMRAAREALIEERRAFDKRMRDGLGRRRPPPGRKKGGGSEPVTVEPNRPKLGEGGAAAALEFDT
jgi:hypothetical protein